MGYDETNWHHQYLRNIAIVTAWVGIGLGVFYFGPHWLSGHNDSRLKDGQVLCGSQPVTSAGCHTTKPDRVYTQDEWIQYVEGAHDEAVRDGWIALSSFVYGGVVLYSVNQADEARKRRDESRKKEDNKGTS